MFQRIALVPIFVLALAAGGPGQGPENIDRLIRQLGAGEFAERESASKRLEKIGKPALAALQLAAKKDADLEVRARAARLIKIIHRSLFHEVRRFEGHNGTNPIWGLWITRLALSPGGRLLVSCGGDGLRLWDTTSGKMLLLFGKECSGVFGRRPFRRMAADSLPPGMTTWPGFGTCPAASSCRP